MHPDCVKPFVQQMYRASRAVSDSVCGLKVAAHVFAGQQVQVQA